MGDVLITTPTVIGFHQTVSGPATYSWAEALDTGTWFATPLHLVQYIIYKWNSSIPGGQASATIETDPDSTNYGKISITPDTGLGTISSALIEIGDTTVAAECGLSGTLTAHNSLTAIPYILAPLWPLHFYERETEALTGYASPAHDGTPYSFFGHFREKVSVGVSIDRTVNSFSEFTRWRTLWNKRWGAGRAVTLYCDRTLVQTSYDGASELADAEALVLESPPTDKLRARRMVDWKEYIDKQETFTFGVRKPLLQVGDTAMDHAGGP